MTYRKYFDSHDPNGPQQFFNSIAGQATSRTMGRDEKGAYVEYSINPITKITVAYNSEVLGQGIFWQGNPVETHLIRNIPARKMAEKTAVDGLTRKAGMWKVWANDSGYIDVTRFPFLPTAVAIVAGYAIHFMAIHGIFQALSALGVR